MSAWAELGERAAVVYRASEPSRADAAAYGGVPAFHALMRSVCDQGAFDTQRRLWRLNEAQALALGARADVSLRLEPLVPIARRAAELAAQLDADALAIGGLADALPTGVVERLLPHQREGVEFVLRCGGRALLADEMGLGKTVQAIAALAAYAADWPALIVAPPSLLAGWRTEVLKWLPEEVLPNASVQTLVSGRDEPRADAQLVLVTYALLEKGWDALARARFGVVVCDESHLLKSADSKRTRAASGLARGARRVILLSGTPATSRPSELHSQLEMLRPGLFGSYEEYTARYCDGHVGRFGWDAKGRSNLDELNRALQGAVMIRRLKDETIKLPHKTRRAVELAQPADALGRALVAARAAVDAKGGARLSRDSTELTALRTATGHAKLVPACAFVERELDACAQRKVLAFAHHRAVLDGLSAALDRRGVRHIRIDGGTAKEARASLVHQFQQEDDVRVAVLSITAAGVGLTLTAASLVVFAELSWNASDLQQAEDRAHRIGQRRPVDVVYLLMRGSIDDLVWPTVNRKLDTVSRALDGHGGSLQAGGGVKRAAGALAFAELDGAGGAPAHKRATNCAPMPGGGAKARIDNYFGHSTVQPRGAEPPTGGGWQ